jgi:hypothetical protein
VRLAAAEAFDPAVALADAAAEAAEGRLPLQTLRAALRLQRAKSPGREPVARRQDVVDAHRILRSLVVAQAGAAPTSPREREAWGAALSLLQSVSAEVLLDPQVTNGARRAALMSGVQAVVLRRDAAGAPRAAGWLAQARALPDLTPLERGQLDAWDAEITRLLHPSPSPR